MSASPEGTHLEPPLVKDCPFCGRAATYHADADSAYCTNGNCAWGDNECYGAPLAKWNERAPRHLTKEEIADLLDRALGIISNAGTGNWESESQEWQVAARKWCDDYGKMSAPSEKPTKEA